MPSAMIVGYGPFQDRQIFYPSIRSKQICPQFLICRSLTATRRILSDASQYSKYNIC